MFFLSKFSPWRIFIHIFIPVLIQPTQLPLSDLTNVLFLPHFTENSFFVCDGSLYVLLIIDKEDYWVRIKYEFLKFIYSNLSWRFLCWYYRQHTVVFSFKLKYWRGKLEAKFWDFFFSVTEDLRLNKNIFHIFLVLLILKCVKYRIYS